MSTDTDQFAHYLQNSLTVAQLRELLADLPDELPVVSAYQYGDRARTTVAPRTHGVEVTYVEWSPYFDLPTPVAEDELRDEAGCYGSDDERVQSGEYLRVLVIR